MKIKTRKLIHARISLFMVLLATLILAIALSGCAPKQTLSGKYVSADNSELYLLFEGNTLAIYEGDEEIDSGDYRFNDNNAIVFTFSAYAGNYTLDDNKENLYFGSSDDDNYGEIAFIKEQGE